MQQPRTYKYQEPIHKRHRVISRTGIELLQFSTVSRSHFKCLIPESDILSVRNEYFTMSAQKCHISGNGIVVKLYQFTVRSNTNLKFTVPKARVALTWILRGTMKLTLENLHSIILSGTAHTILTIPSGTYRQLLPAGEYQVLLLFLKERFMLKHCLAHHFLAAHLNALRANFQYSTSIPFNISIQEHLGLVKKILEHNSVDAPLDRFLFDALIMKLIVLTFRDITFHQSRIRCDEPLTASLKLLVEEVKEYIVQHFSEPITITAICRELDIARQNIEDDFKLVTGQSLLEFITELRIEKATELLALPLTVDEIAKESGFKSESLLIAAFQRKYNCLPQEYRAAR